MPPISPQGSRGGLVAAVVIFTILFVTATIFAIYFGVQDNQAELSNAQLQQRYNTVVRATALDAPEVAQLITAAGTDDSLQDKTALAEAIHQRDNLRRMILGVTTPSTQPTDKDTKDAIANTLKAANASVAAANLLLKAPKETLVSDNLVSTVTTLSTEVRRLTGAMNQALADRQAALDQSKKDAASAEAASKLAQDAADKLKQKVQEISDAEQAAIQKSQGDAEQAAKTFADEQKYTRDQADEQAKQIAARDSEIDTLKKETQALTEKLSRHRVDVMDPIVRRTQGQIIQIADASTVYINLGRGDQVVPGMTFEVYDKTKPLPKLGDGMSDEALPVGKASIEIVHVLADSSECHINHVEPGEQMVQGDPILNLVYDRNVKLNFFVYGDFDVARTGRTTPAGADVVKRLITQWGGTVQNQIDPQTDFVVMGAPVDVPVFTAEELNDPLNQEALSNAKEKAKTYDEKIQRAQNLSIPILNQNRFLYYTGYYDVAAR